MRQSHMAVGRSHPADEQARKPASSTRNSSRTTTASKMLVKQAKGSMQEITFKATEWEDQSDASENTNNNNEP